MSTVYDYGKHPCMFANKNLIIDYLLPCGCGLHEHLSAHKRACLHQYGNICPHVLFLRWPFHYEFLLGIYEKKGREDYVYV